MHYIARGGKVVHYSVGGTNALSIMGQSRALFNRGTSALYSRGQSSALFSRGYK